MALGTTIQYTESNLIGTLYAPITSSATSIQVQFVDKVTGAARTPDANTKLFVIDKGSENAPNPNYEIILVGSHSTTSGITTLTGCTRGLAFSGYSLAAVTANQKSHTAGAVIGCVDVHYLWNSIVSTLKGTGDMVVVPTFATEAALASDVPSPTDGQTVYVTALNSFLFRNNGKWWGTPILVFADNTARDASITSPSNGMKIYNTAAGAFQGYVAGSWTNEGTSTTPNMSLTGAGKGEEATAAEIIANTQTGGTGADLIVNPKYLSDASVTTSAGAGDAAKYVRANSAGEIDSTLLPTNFTKTPVISITAGETLATGDWIYRATADGKAYKADNTTIEKANVIGVVTTGGILNATVYYQGNGTKYVTTGLTAGATYYLSGTAGQKTTTAPVQNSASVIPVILFKAGSTTEADIRIQRIPRRMMVVTDLASSPITNGATTTVTLGIPISYLTVEVNGSSSSTSESNSVVGYGYYDVLAATQMSNSTLITPTVAHNLATTSTTKVIAFGMYSGGAVTITGTGSISSNNLVITWSVSTGLGIQCNLLTIAYEAL